MRSIGFLTSSEFCSLVASASEVLSSQLTIYIYDLVTGLVGSYRRYFSGRSLCQTEKGDTYIHTPVYK